MADDSQSNSNEPWYCEACAARFTFAESHKGEDYGCPKCGSEDIFEDDPEMIAQARAEHASETSRAPSGRYDPASFGDDE